MKREKETFRSKKKHEQEIELNDVVASIKKHEQEEEIHEFVDVVVL